MRLYELVVVLRASLSEKDRVKLFDTIKGWLKDLKITKEESWGQKPLSYRIKKEIAGYYQMMQLEGENALPADFEKRLFAQENVIRHLLIRKK